MDASSSPDASPLSSVAAASADEFDLLAFVRSHIILLFFAVLGVSSLSWMIGFNMLAGSKEVRHRVDGRHVREAAAGEEAAGRRIRSPFATSALVSRL